MGEPALPEAVPAAAVSPGKRICSFVTVPALTAIAGLESEDTAGWVTSEAVTVWFPAVLKVILNDWLPVTSPALAGAVAFESDNAMLTVSLVLTTFQKLSTAFAVTLNAVPATCALGVPVLPVTVPGAAVSPGARSCSLANDAGRTTTLAEVAPVNPDALKLIVIVVATLWARSAKLTNPPTAAKLVVPCDTPLPAFRAALTMVVLSLEHKLPKASSIRITG